MIFCPLSQIWLSDYLAKSQLFLFFFPVTREREIELSTSVQLSPCFCMKRVNDENPTWSFIPTLNQLNQEELPRRKKRGWALTTVTWWLCNKENYANVVYSQIFKFAWLSRHCKHCKKKKTLTCSKNNVFKR